MVEYLLGQFRLQFCAAAVDGRAGGEVRSGGPVVTGRPPGGDDVCVLVLSGHSTRWLA